MDTDISRWIRTKISKKNNIQKDKARRGRLIKIDRKRSVKIEKKEQARKIEIKKDQVRSWQSKIEKEK